MFKRKIQLQVSTVIEEQLESFVKMCIGPVTKHGQKVVCS